MRVYIQKGAVSVRLKRAAAACERVGLCTLFCLCPTCAFAPPPPRRRCSPRTKPPSENKTPSGRTRARAPPPCRVWRARKEQETKLKRLQRWRQRSVLVCARATSARAQHSSVCSLRVSCATFDLGEGESPGGPDAPPRSGFGRRGRRLCADACALMLSLLCVVGRLKMRIRIHCFGRCAAARLLSCVGSKDRCTPPAVLVFFVAAA